MVLNPRTKAWITTTRQRTQTRCDDLLRRVDFDPAEVITVGTLWIDTLYRLFWQSHHRMTKANMAMVMVLGEDLLTATLIALSVMGAMAFLLFLPKLRRNIDLAIATYFVTNGVITLFVIHDSNLALRNILIFGVAGYWTFWRQGQGQYGRRRDDKNHRGDRGYSVPGSREAMGETSTEITKGA